MPTQRFTARWLGVSGLPEDVYENVLYYDVPATTERREAICDAIVAAFDAWDYHGGINGAEMRVYAPEGGQPLFSKSYAYAHTAATAPGEVALCLSYAAVTDWETTTARRRGRLFLGPLSVSTITGPRPTQTLITAALDLGVALEAAAAPGEVWQVYSTVDQVGATIQSISVDNAWDTQRRRGLSPTTREVRTV